MKNKLIYTFLSAIISLFLLEDICIASPIAKNWIYSTILIENEWNDIGTGFLVYREVNESGGLTFLCTNKHVLNKDKALRDKANKIKLHLNIKEADDQIIGKVFEYELKNKNGEKKWKEHPDQNIDVLVIDVTDLMIKESKIIKKFVTYSMFTDSNMLIEKEITIGDDVMIIGYPLGFKQGNTNFPVVRQGIIASQIGKEFVNEIFDNKGNIKRKTYRGFLIDGGIIPGSSGSPVVLKPGVPHVIEGRMVIAPSVLLGIVAETRFAPIERKPGDIIPSYAGMGIAFDAQTIKETMELFFQ